MSCPLSKTSLLTDFFFCFDLRDSDAVTQGSNVGTLSIGLNGVRPTTIVITAAAGQSFVPAMNVVIGSDTILEETVADVVHNGIPEELLSFPKKIEDKNPEFVSPSTIDVVSLGESRVSNPIQIKYLSPSTAKAYIKTGDGLKFQIEIVSIDPPSEEDKSDENLKDLSLIVVKFPPGTGTENQFTIEVAGNPTEPIIVEYPPPTVTGITLSSETLYSANFQSNTVGDEIIVKGTNFGPLCEQLTLPVVSVSMFFIVVVYIVRVSNNAYAIIHTYVSLFTLFLPTSLVSFYI